MIPTRTQVASKVAEWEAGSKSESLEGFISAWLDTLSLPETIIVASNVVNPKEQILSDLESYVKQSS